MPAEPRNNVVSREAIQKTKLHLAPRSPLIRTCISPLFIKPISTLLTYVPIIGSFQRRLNSLAWAYTSEGDFFASPSSHLPNYLKEEHGGKTYLEHSTGENFGKVEHHNAQVYDFVVIGSGPGAVAALLEIPKDQRVLVLERGGVHQTHNDLFHTLGHVACDFRKSGKEFIIARGLPQFSQGSVLGGGSEVNSGLYHRLPQETLDNFARIASFNSEEFRKIEESVTEFLQVQVKEAESSLSIIALGAEKLGLEFRNIPRWRKYDNKGGFVHYGMNKLFWDHIGELGFESKGGCLEVRTRTTAKEIVTSPNLKVIGNDGREFFANKVIVAGGSIETARLLASGGFVKWSDTNFHWHCMNRVICQTDENVLGFLDVDPFQAWTHDLQFKFGSGATNPGMVSLSLGRKVNSDKAKLLRTYYSSFQSTGQGGLLPGLPYPWYRFSNLDRERIEIASDLLIKLVSSGGAKPQQSMEEVREKLSTVHIFGTLPAGEEIYLKGTNALKNDHRVIVADGSLLPFGPGVNPQGPIMTLSRILTRKALEL